MHEQETVPLRFIHVDVVWLGYCDNCGRAAIVGVFSIRGWKHRFSLCRFCINLIGELLQVGESWISKRLNHSNPMAWGDEVVEYVKGVRTAIGSSVGVLEPVLDSENGDA